jgi:PRC-barrel domain
LPGERVELLIICWHGASYVEVFTLERQARTDKFTEEVAHRFAGYTVYDQDYEKIGNVDDLFLDQSDHPEYIGVKMGFLGTRTTLIPFQMARVNDARQIIEVAADKETLKNGPTFDDDREITPQFENEVYSYYGLQRASTIEQSSTYAAHSAEQSTQTTGRIKEAGGTKDNVTDELDEAAGRGRRRRDDRKEAAPEEVGQPGSGGVKANVRDEWAESQERR